MLFLVHPETAWQTPPCENIHGYSQHPGQIEPRWLSISKLAMTGSTSWRTEPSWQIQSLEASTAPTNLRLPPSICSMNDRKLFFVFSKPGRQTSPSRSIQRQEQHMEQIWLWCHSCIFFVWQYVALLDTHIPGRKTASENSESVHWPNKSGSPTQHWLSELLEDLFGAQQGCQKNSTFGNVQGN